MLYVYQIVFTLVIITVHVHCEMANLIIYPSFYPSKSQMSEMYFKIHFLLSSESGIPFELVAAIDINTTANEIYKHNFPNTTLWNKTIEVSLVTEQLASQQTSDCSIQFGWSVALQTDLGDALLLCIILLN